MAVRQAQVLPHGGQQSLGLLRIRANSPQIVEEDDLPVYSILSLDDVSVGLR
jgi:hypothetical protein